MRVWNARTKEPELIDTYSFGNNKKIYKATFSKDQAFIGIAGNSDLVQIVNFPSLTLHKTIPTGQGLVRDFDFSFDSTKFITCGDKKMILWDLASSSIIKTFNGLYDKCQCHFGSNDRFAMSNEDQIIYSSIAGL